ncbi:MAG: hypothetical protein ACTHK4_11375 [Mycobacteriales bacterium]
MSDTSILPPPGVEAGAGLPGEPVPGFDDEPTGDRRRLLIIGGVVGVVLIAVVAYLLLKGGGSSSSPTASGLVPHGTPHAAAPPPGSNQGGSAHGSTGGGAKAGTTLPKKSTTRLARDPFKPLISLNAPAGNTTGSTTSDSPAPSQAPGTVPTTPAQGGAPSAAVGPPQAIRLLRVNGDKSAVFAVTYRHNKTYDFNVAAPSASSSSGTVFAQDFALLGIQGQEATIQIGDDTPFDLKRGVTHRV